VALRLNQIAVFVRASMRSRLAWILVCLHAAWFFLAIANMAPPSRAFAHWLESGGSDVAVLAGRPFHFIYQSLAMQLLFLADMPSMIAAVPVALLISPLMRLAALDLYSGSYVGAALMLIFASCQWLAIGNFIESRLSSSNCGKSFLAWLHRYFALLAAFVLLFTAVATPLVNAHSREVAYHRHAIPSQ
jgi:hypothetical protein